MNAKDFAKNSTGYKQLLLREILARRTRNGQYSLRAFARDVGLQPSKLSEVLNGHRGLSKSSAEKIIKKLQWTPVENLFFVTSVESEHARSPAVRAQAQEKLESIKVQQGFSEISLDLFKVVSDWHHFALLELTETKTFRNDPRWISVALGISVEEVRSAIQRLIDSDLLRKSGDGSLRPTQKDLATPTQIPSREIRSHHTQLIQKGLISLHEDDIAQRDFSSTMMAINTDQLPEAKKWLQEFRRKFCKKMQGQGSRDRVYCLNLGFFPVDKLKANENIKEKKK